MDIVTSTPVKMNRLESVSALFEQIQENVTRRAYEKFVNRGCVHGHDREDWLSAERELIVSLDADARCTREDLVVEAVLPEIELQNLSVHVAPTHLIITSDPDEDGRQVLQVVHLPAEISLDSVDAERMRNMLRFTAALAPAFEIHRATA